MDIDITRIGQDLWPQMRRLRIQQALRAKDGTIVHITEGEAETIARQETERAVNHRLSINDPGRPKKKPRPNYCDIQL